MKLEDFKAGTFKIQFKDQVQFKKIGILKEKNLLNLRLFKENTGNGFIFEDYLKLFR
jgi:hypothetical protein